MKSFFKKLSFVMALAMVVSLVAPAAKSVFAADTFTFAKQNDETKTAVTELHLEVGQEEDLRFVGVKGYSAKTFTCKWESTNEKVATVDKNGVIKAVANGLAQIKLVISGNDTVYTADPVTVYVGKEEEEAPVAAITAKQTTSKKIELTFAGVESVDKSKLEFFYTVLSYKIAFAYKDVKVEGNKVTLESFTKLSDGTEYGFTYEGKTATVKATIGDVDSMVITGPQSVTVGENKDIEYKLFNAQGVDITDCKPVAANVYFSLVVTPEDGSYYVAGSQIHFDKAGVAAVKGEYYSGEYDDEGNPVGYKENVATVVGKEKAPYALDQQDPVKATIGTDFDHATLTVSVSDNGATPFLSIKLRDNGHNDPFTVNKDHLINDQAGDDGGSFRFESTNPGKLYVADNGELVANAAGVVPVLVYFQSAKANTRERVVSLVNVDVREARKASSLEIADNKYSVTVAWDDQNDAITVDASEKTATVKVVLKDQLGNKIDGTVEVNAKSVPSTLTAPTVTGAGATTGGELTLTFSVDNTVTTYFSNANVNSQSYTFEIKVGNMSKNVTVLVKRPIATSTQFSAAFNNVDDLKTEDTSAKKLTVTLAKTSNGIKIGSETITGKQIKITANDKPVAGKYYFTLTKNNEDISNKAVLEGASNESFSINLTKLTPVSVNGDDISIVESDNGVGTYVAKIFKGVGANDGEPAPAYSLIASGSKTVKNTTPAGVTVAKTAATFNSAIADDIAAQCFKYTVGGKEVKLEGGVYKCDGKIVKIDASSVNTSTDGEFVFVNTVDLYVATSGAATVFVKYTVTVNDYVTVQP